MASEKVIVAVGIGVDVTVAVNVDGGRDGTGDEIRAEGAGGTCGETQADKSNAKTTRIC